MRNKLFILLACFQLCLAGCATIQVEECLEGKTKTEIMQIWGSPTKIYTQPDKLKYGADEMWLYVTPYSSEYRFYFKDDITIKKEYVTYSYL